mmetsp:Transcript_86228/g.252225  ORF Transcript_86228/g.252225 Transcript_86228/m.252225 type:complete len:251 (+) Transcript_86228:99-851(+)
MAAAARLDAPAAASPKAATAPDNWFRAAAAGDVEELCRLADWGAGLDARDCRSMTALMISSAHGHASCLSVLAKRGAELDAIDARGWTAVTHAAFAGREGCLRVLAENGADLNVRDFLGTTAAMRAALGGHERCLRVLAEHRADLRARDNLGLAAAAHAQRRGHGACLQLLLEWGIMPPPGLEVRCGAPCKKQRKAEGAAAARRPKSCSARLGAAKESGRQEALGRFIASALRPRWEKDCLFGLVGLPFC